MNAPTIRSSFVTVLAWIFIMLSGLTSFIGILQNVMIQALFLPVMQQQALHGFTPTGMSAPLAWMPTLMPWFFRAFLLLSLVTLTAAIGLLHRKNWARKLFIGLLALGIAYQLGGVAVQWWMFGHMGDMVAQMPGAPPRVDAVMQGMLTVMRVFGLMMALAFSGLFAWLILRLRRADVRAEFGEVAERGDTDIPTAG